MWWFILFAISIFPLGSTTNVKGWFLACHNIHHNYTQQNDIEHNGIQQNKNKEKSWVSNKSNFITKVFGNTKNNNSVNNSVLIRHCLIVYVWFDHINQSCDASVTL
jgi:hypothetical protein